jgi:Lrp/AsnC family leucine-responsive transcriptional regulator
MTTAELDRIDKKILYELEKDARITNNDLADKVGLSPTPCWKRVKNLEAKGFIKGYHAVLDAGMLGYGDIAIVQIQLDKHGDEMLKNFDQALAGIPEIIDAYIVTGEFDYMIIAAVSSMTHYEKFIREKLYKIPGIQHSHTSFVVRRLELKNSLLFIE